MSILRPTQRGLRLEPPAIPVRAGCVRHDEKGVTYPAGSGIASTASYGDRIRLTRQVGIGDLLIMVSGTAACINVMEVVKVFPDREKFYSRFVDPINPWQPRLAGDTEMCVWNHELKVNRYYRYIYV